MKHVAKSTPATFPLRCYSKKELSMLFFPDTDPRVSSRHLFTWVKRNADLSARLEALHYNGRQRILTPAQVAVIFSFLGVPEELQL